MDMDDRRGPLERRENAGFFEEALAAPHEIFRKLRRARDDHRAVFANRKRRRQIFLDRDFPAQRRVACIVGDAEATVAKDGKQLVVAQPRSDGKRAAVSVLCGVYFRVCRPSRSWRIASSRPATLPYVGSFQSGKSHRMLGLSKAAKVTVPPSLHEYALVQCTERCRLFRVGAHAVRREKDWRGGGEVVSVRSIELKPLIGRLNEVCRRALESAAGVTALRTHYNVEIEHMLVGLLDRTDTDLAAILRRWEIDPSRLLADLTTSLDRM